MKIKIPKIPKLFTDVKAWFDGIASTTVAGYAGVKKYKKIEKLNKVRVLFLTSDYGIYGINEQIYAVVNNVEDLCRIEGLDRVYFGDKKRGIITYRDTNGQDFIVVTDGNHQAIDINTIAEDIELKANETIIDKLIDVPKQVENEEKRKALEKAFDELNLKEYGITLDLNIHDDHENKKDLTVFADKVMTHGFFKSLARFPMKTIVMVFMLGGFTMTTALMVFLFIILMLYLTLMLVI